MHGYGIAQMLKVTSEDVLEVGESSLYPALQRLLLEWLGGRGMGRVREQPPRPLLHAHRRRAQTIGRRTGRFRAHGGRNPASAPDHIGGHHGQAICAACDIGCNRGRMDAELAEEMEFHRAMLAANGGARRRNGQRYAGARGRPRASGSGRGSRASGRTRRTALRTYAAGTGLHGHRPARAGQRDRAQHAACSPCSTHSPCGRGRCAIRRAWSWCTGSCREGGGISGSRSTATSRSIPRAFSGLIAMRNGEQVKMRGSPAATHVCQRQLFPRTRCRDGARPWIPGPGGPDRRRRRP